MIICSCNAISDTSVKASIHSEKCPRTPGAVYRCLGCKPCCGRCFVTVRAIIDEAMSQAGETAAVAETNMTIARLDEHRHMHAHETAHTHAAGACADNCEACAAAAA
jgi:bacterioferritin-associated ferredoxin